MNARSISLVCALLAACQAAGETPAAVSPAGVSSGAAPLEAAALRELPAARQAAEGTDALPSRRFELSVGASTRVLPPALAAALQGPAAVVWLPDHRLARYGISGAPVLLARDVGSPPWVGDELLVYAREVGAAVSLFARRGDVETPLAGGLASAGAFRVEGRRVFFVGSANGGVAGLWVASLDGAPARCLTNCELRVGRPWGDAYVPPPPSAEALEPSGDTVSYAVDGQRVSRRIP